MIWSFARVLGMLALAVGWAALFVTPPTALIASPVSVEISRVLPQPAPSSEPARPEPAKTSAPASRPSASISGMRIAIPRLSIDLPLELGDVARDVPRPGFAGATPENAALIYPGTSLPGDGGNTYVYAHARAGMFLNLWSVRVGDGVVVLRPDGSVLKTYRVRLVVARVDPLDAHWLEPGGPERLTLQTSTGPRPNDPRFIAVAYPEDQTSVTR